MPRFHRLDTGGELKLDTIILDRIMGCPISCGGFHYQDSSFVLDAIVKWSTGKNVEVYRHMVRREQEDVRSVILTPDKKITHCTVVTYLDIYYQQLMKTKTTREQVYKAIDSERDYQDKKWNPDTTPTGGVHTLTEWLVYIEDYINEAKHIASRKSDDEANENISHIMRKIGGMAVAAMEQNGAPLRVNHFDNVVKGIKDLNGGVIGGGTKSVVGSEYSRWYDGK